MNHSTINNSDAPLSEKALLDRIKFLEHVIEVQEKIKMETDISLLRETESNQTKSRFVSIASHEFRTFLTRIHLSASLIRDYHDRLDEEKIFIHLDKIKVAVGDLTTILEDFLSIEKIDSCKVVPVWSKFNLSSLVKEVVIEMELLTKSGQQIKYEHSGTDTHVNLDKKLLKHCLVNLISNAIKYSNVDGCITLKTEIQQGSCHISIKDEGMGIPEPDQAHLFEAFFRANNTANIQGAGLGLNIVKRYAGLMRGRINFQSTENIGTVFTLSFPIIP